MKITTGSNLLASATFAVLALAGTPVQADLLDFNLTASNLGGGFSGPFAHVQVNQTSTTTATLTFTSLTNGGYTYLLGGQGAVAANISGTYTLGSLAGIGTNSFASFTPGPYSNGGTANENGWGSFKQTIDSFDGFTHSATTISFAITATGATSWASAAAVLTANAGGSLAAAHVFACPVACDIGDTAALTGYAAGTGGSSPPTEVSEPNSASIALLALGLLGAGFWTRRKS